MKTTQEWEEDIITLTTKIISRFPELSKYIEEIPVIETESAGVNRENLEAYYQSLEAIFNKYSTTHDGE